MAVDGFSLSQWARKQAPQLSVVSASTPDPLFRSHNLVAIGSNPDDARDIVLAWERIEPADGAVGLVVLGRDQDLQAADAADGVDREGVASNAASKALRGAIPGAIIGGLLIGLIFVLDGWDAGFWGGALGGAMFGAVAGAVIWFVKGTGWGTAYEESFVDPKAATVVLASIHAESADSIEQAARVVTGHTSMKLHRIDRAGNEVDQGWLGAGGAPSSSKNKSSA